jgi:hypothetical protein
VPGVIVGIGYKQVLGPMDRSFNLRVYCKFAISCSYFFLLILLKCQVGCGGTNLRSQLLSYSGGRRINRSNIARAHYKKEIEKPFVFYTEDYFIHIFSQKRRSPLKNISKQISEILKSEFLYLFAGISDGAGRLTLKKAVYNAKEISSLKNYITGPIEHAGPPNHDEFGES